jgi:SepF-like predicted cell division protein (DUF552 family)
MAEFFTAFKSKISGFLGGGEEPDEMKKAEQEYVELDTSGSESGVKSKITVRPFVVDSFEGIKDILDVLREGTTIALINIKPLKEKDLIELKRAINKLKKTTDAISGDIAGFGEDYIVATPHFARIHRFKGPVAPAAAAPSVNSDEAEIM